MKTIKNLLEMLSERFPPEEGMRHNITLHEEHLVVTLMCEPSISCIVGEDELEKPIEELVSEICDLVAAEVGNENI